MKFSIIFLLIASMVIFVHAAPGILTKQQENQIIDEYFVKFSSRGGRSAANDEKRRKNVIKRYYDIEAHNERFKNGQETYSQALNEFSQLNEEELKKLSGFELPEDYKVTQNQTLPPSINGDRKGRVTVPKYYNWADDEAGPVVQAVQDQGGCNSCYVFAAIGVLEGSMCRYHKQCIKLSEQEAMECTNGCNNGWDDTVYDYTRKKFGGCAYANNLHYTPYTRSGCAAYGSRVPKSKVYSHYTLTKDAEIIKKFLFQYGPLFMALDLYEPFYSYSSGIYSSCSGNKFGGHAVLLTGFGEENGVKYWIAKNSWGTNFGESGYFKILRGSNACNVEGYRVSFAWTE